MPADNVQPIGHNTTLQDHSNLETELIACTGCTLFFSAVLICLCTDPQPEVEHPTCLVSPSSDPSMNLETACSGDPLSGVYVYGVIKNKCVDKKQVDDLSETFLDALCVTLS